jgi:hypothetical protein
MNDPTGQLRATVRKLGSNPMAKIYLGEFAAELDAWLAHVDARLRMAEGLGTLGPQATALLAVARAENQL